MVLFMMLQCKRTPIFDEGTMPPSHELAIFIHNKQMGYAKTIIFESRQLLKDFLAHSFNPYRGAFELTSLGIGTGICQAFIK